MALVKTDLIALTEYYTKAYIAALGINVTSDKWGLGDGTYGASKAIADGHTALLALVTDEYLTYLHNSSLRLKTDVLANQRFAANFSELLQDLNRLAAAAGISGVTDLSTYCSYYNIGAGGPWTCLLPPEFGQLWRACGAAGDLDELAVYCARLQGTTFGLTANALGKFVYGGSFSAGTAIDDTLYAGGVGQVKWTGGTGNGVVSVTCVIRLSDGTVLTAQTGTATMTANATGTAAIAVAGKTNFLILSCSAISLGSGITGGTFYVEAAQPSTRTYPLYTGA